MAAAYERYKEICFVYTAAILRRGQLGTAPQSPRRGAIHKENALKISQNLSKYTET